MYWQAQNGMNALKKKVAPIAKAKKVPANDDQA